jgi:hypothetical protein
MSRMKIILRPALALPILLACATPAYAHGEGGIVSLVLWFVCAFALFVALLFWWGGAIRGLMALMAYITAVVLAGAVLTSAEAFGWGVLATVIYFVSLFVWWAGLLRTLTTFAAYLAGTGLALLILSAYDLVFSSLHIKLYIHEETEYTLLGLIPSFGGWVADSPT